MPSHLPRDEAIRQIRQEYPDVACIACHLRAHGQHLAESDHAFALLSAFPRVWGHTLVLLKEHRTRLSDVPDAEWLDASRLALRAAQAVERLMNPARCYVASIGSSTEGLSLTFPHLHIHVLPVADPDTRPHEVFASDSMLCASEEEWRQLHEGLRNAWGGQGDADKP